MAKLFINGNRNGYDTEQCGRTMTVCELMAYLDQFEDDTPVYLKNDNGYTYGSIREEDFSDDFEEDEEDEEEIFCVLYYMENIRTGEKAKIQEEFSDFYEAESFLNRVKHSPQDEWIRSDFNIVEVTS